MSRMCRFPSSFTDCVTGLVQNAIVHKFDTLQAVPVSICARDAER